MPSHAVEHSTPEQVNVALTEILRDDMNVDISRITPDSRLIDDVGLECMHIFGGWAIWWTRRRSGRGGVT